MDTDQRSRIELELTRLNNAFVYHMDHGEFEEMVELLTPDGYFNRAGAVLGSHSEIIKSMRERPKATTRHLLANLHFMNITPESAEATISLMVYNGPPQENGQPVQYATENGRLVEFIDKYVRTADGWRISSRIVAPVFVPKNWP